jgi:cell pole-organizing protein PopZ
MPEAAGADGRDPSMAEILASIQRILSENEPEDRAARPAPAAEVPPRELAPEPAPKPEPEMHPELAAHIAPAPAPRVEEPVAEEPVLSAAPPAPPEEEDGEVLVLEKSMMVNDGATSASTSYKSSLLEAATSRDPMPSPSLASAAMPHPFPLPEEEPVAAAPVPAAPSVRPDIVPPLPAHTMMPTMIPPANLPIRETRSEEGLVAPDTVASAQSAIGNLVRTLAAERVVPVQRGGLTIEDLVREELRPLLKAWLDQHLPPLVEKLVQVEIERVVNRATS